MEKLDALRHWYILYSEINAFCIDHNIWIEIGYLSQDLKEADYIFGKEGYISHTIHIVYTNSTVSESEFSECSKAIIKKLKQYFSIGGVDMDIRIRDNILDKAKEIINGECQGQYGKPENSFQRIAEFWSGYLGKQLSDYDVANMLILMKVARNAGGVYKDDNWIDICGYAAIGAELQAASKED